MYVSQPSNPNPWGDDWGGAGDGYIFRSSGYRFNDTAGVLAPGTTGPGIRDVGGGSSIFDTFDARHLLSLPASQSLLLTGYFNYRYDSLSVASAPGAGLHADSYALGGDAFWRVGSTYFDGSAAYTFGHADAADQFNGGAGSFNAHGYFVDARLGNMFPLWTTAGVPSAAPFPTKAPPKPIVGSIVALDLSGHIGYAASALDGFTDSTGFTLGGAQAHDADIGARARLLALIPSHDVLWMPFVSATIDQLFDYSNNVNIPVQAALTSGDVVSIQMAKTFAGAELGIEGRSLGGWTFGVKGSYQASADTSIVGGVAYLKIPFYSTLAPGTRY